VVSYCFHLNLSVMSFSIEDLTLDSGVKLDTGLLAEEDYLKGVVDLVFKFEFQEERFEPVAQEL